MKTRFYNARILPLVNGSIDIMNGEVWTDGDKISYVGESRTDMPTFDTEIDCKRNIIMPGFKNAHAHAPMTFLRSAADDMPLYDWLNKQIFPREAHLTADDIYNLTKLALLEYISGGITSSFEMYAHPEAMAKACVEYGFRCVFVSPLNNFTSSLQQMRDEYETLNKIHPLISYKLGFHAEYTTSAELLAGTANMANELHAPVYMHGSETKDEVDECISRYGKTPTEYFDSIGMFNYGGGIYHGVWLTDNDIDIIKKRGVAVVTNPASNSKLASGIAPITKLLANDVHIAIGTDGPASNNCLDMFREMFMVTALAKLRENDAAVCDAAEVLKMAVNGGAYAMGLDNCSCIEADKQADIIMLDLNKPNMQPLNNIAKNIVYSANKQNVCLTMINGKILYRDGQYFVNDKPEDVYKKANEIAERINNSVN